MSLHQLLSGLKLPLAGGIMMRLLMEEILHLLMVVNPVLTGLYKSQVVQDFFHQQYLKNHTTEKFSLFFSLSDIL